MVGIYKKIIGIVAEYNPFHNGHLFHLGKARENKDDAIVVVLSSYFTQRGEPAIMSKWDRAESALRAGANLVLELPAFFSCHNAGVFAAGAVDILAAAGVVDSLSFGMEQPEFDTAPILDILVHEPSHFKDNLKKKLNSGFSYVKARAAALEEIHGGWGTFVSLPNNTLALSYMERIAKKGYCLSCRPVQRKGAGFHDTTLGDALPSAAAVRKALAEGNREKAQKALPSSTVGILSRCIRDGKVVLSGEMLWRLTRFLILRTPPEELARSSEMTEGMENRMKKYAALSTSWPGFVSQCITARYPRGRIQRQLIHFLLGIGHQENRKLQRSGPQYIRVLGADVVGMEILRKMRSAACLPVMGKAPAGLKGEGLLLAGIEQTACTVWEELTSVFSPGEEKKRHPLMGECFPEGENVP
ncbi:putative nucleotidyltransferase [Aminivibrio pyruvatiphilus]|jgi:predicted nucleotidyltransferase|uniref:tRNA(Met) cytidine acetate ligase n=1 Tax=Aminivibrio pyruvatiphilus TaxID=1005740 RepID=A0A4R8MDB8_9BACT|nr:nucleotidyltransferase family protein [Aminivibrio pyruvatiphilus]TDY61796.1 putative nucleotidyltransferase [Aminivibrio pyruvatiphilus]